MNTPLLAVMAAINFGIAVGYVLKKNYGMAVAFLGYTIATAGFIISKGQS
jgi:chromate transport protein ChrA